MPDHHLRGAALAICTTLLSCLCAQEAAPPTVRLTGRVVQWDGTPVGGAAVGVSTPNDADTQKLLLEPTVVADAEGRFALTVTPPQVQPGTFTTPVQLHVAGKGIASQLRWIPWRTKHENELVLGPWLDPETAARGIAFAPETDVGDIVVTEGKQLVGRVRGEDGKPLAGARVVATDLLEARNSMRDGSAGGSFCAVTTDASGIFKLPCALPSAAVVEVALGGFYREWRQPVSASTPLEVTMHPSGWIRGRVLGPEGRSVPDAWITVNYELRAATSPVRCEADGSFRVPLDSPGRWRIHANGPPPNGWQTDSPLHTGPVEHFELLVEPTAATAKARIPVRAVVKKDRSPVADFRAAAVWDQYAQQDGNYREYRCRTQLRGAKPPEDGVAQVGVPDEGDNPTGVLRVVAKGFAPFTKTDLEWKEPAAGEPVEPVVVELEPEAVVRGIVRDEQTGAPLAGVKVGAEPVYEQSGWYTEDRQLDVVTTGDDGAFELRGLGEGKWHLEARHEKRPDQKPIDVTLAAAEQKQGVVIDLPAGATVRGRVTGLETTHGVHVQLSPIPATTYAAQPFFFDTFGGGMSTPGGKNVRLGADGSFAFDGVALDSYMLVVRLPAHPRLGSDLYLPIEPFRVRKAGIDRAFDAAEDRPGRIDGRIAFPRAAIPHEQLLVVAQVTSERSGLYLSPYDQSFNGPRAFVGRDGGYELMLTAGDYRVLVVDLATGAIVHLDETNTSVAVGKAIAHDLTLDLVKIDVEFAPAAGVAAMADLDRVEVRFLPKALKAMAEQWSGNEEYDNGGGCWLQPGQKSLQLALPEGNATFLCRANTMRIRTDENRWNNPPVGRAEFEVGIGPNANTKCRVEVGAPVEVQGEADEKKKQEDAGGGGR